MPTLLHRLDFDIVLRKLISKAQAFSQRIHETSMVRFYSSVNANDKMLIRQMSSAVNVEARVILILSSLDGRT